MQGIHHWCLANVEMYSPELIGLMTHLWIQKSVQLLISVLLLISWDGECPCWCIQTLWTRHCDMKLVPCLHGHRCISTVWPSLWHLPRVQNITGVFGLVLRINSTNSGKQWKQFYLILKTSMPQRTILAKQAIHERDHQLTIPLLTWPTMTNLNSIKRGQ